MNQAWKELESEIDGDVQLDALTKTIYSTDASAYQERPLGAAFPKHTKDIQTLVKWAQKHQIGLIPRAAGTSLAGQVVGSGLVVDISRYMTSIVEVNEEEGYAWIEPGVIRDELNHFLEPKGWFYGPETSTSNRCMIGGMVGNNSCGARSLVYGSAREHLLEAEVVLANGAITVFKDVEVAELERIVAGESDKTELEVELYTYLYTLLKKEENQATIHQHYPHADIPRRNTGYALDMLLRQAPFQANGKQFNLCALLAGSEGTLAFITRLKVNLEPVLPPVKGLVAIHFNSVHDALNGNLQALEFGPTACELMDHYILECTKSNAQHAVNRFFVEGDPKAILVVEFCEQSEEELHRKHEALKQQLQSLQLGYAFPLVTGSNMKKVWDLRKAGLGLLSNIPGDAKPAPVIEDTAVRVQDLPQFIDDFNAVLAKRDLFCVHYAHAATGELHLRPILNLKTTEGNAMFKTIAQDIATLVKQYRGSLSGEHGDGRLRGEFISYMYGETITKWFEDLKRIADPKAIFNPGKIVHTPSMNEQLRYAPGQATPQFDTQLDFSEQQGLLRAVEMCNGSGDCRKTEITGGTMCPSYMATRNERDTTRARANTLRYALTTGKGFEEQEVKDVLDLCLSCKGCKTECPSNVDMAKVKSEVLYQQHQISGASLRSKALAFSMELQQKWPRLNPLVRWSQKGVPGKLLKRVLGIAPERTLPIPAKKSFHSLNLGSEVGEADNGEVVLWIDEFTNLQEPQLGMDALTLLTGLGYKVHLPQLPDSGRTFISKGFLVEAKQKVNAVMSTLKPFLEKGLPVVGLEPSVVLGLRDEYPDLYEGTWQKKWSSLGMLVEEFIVGESEKGTISQAHFEEKKGRVRIHGHCHQKSLSSVNWTKRMVRLVEGMEVLTIPSGCCGMAGSFGYEKEHYSLSMQIGELVLFPTIRSEKEATIILAPGTSCRHQIKDGTGKDALHPVTFMADLIRKKRKA